jgi:hypothetical protein
VRVELAEVPDINVFGMYAIPFILYQTSLKLCFFTAENQVKSRPFFGMPTEGVLPISPEADITYPKGELSLALPPAVCVEVPPPPAEPPEGWTYPESPTWTLRQDDRFQSGWIYYADYIVSQKWVHRERLLATITPPHTVPSYEDGKFVAQPIPGMVHMTAGIPYVFFLDGDPARVQTAGCLQTLESLRWYPDFQDIYNECIRLAKLSWGCPEHGSPGIRRLSRLEGLKRNARSSNVSFADDSTDGSYNLANTVLKGEGQGVVLPAVQVDTSEGTAQIGAVLKCLHALHRSVLRKCISKFEFDVGEFHSEINNVVSFGGLEPSGTSVQYNVSSLSDEALHQLIGAQGAWHNDMLDCVTRFTMFVLMIATGPST